MVPICDFTNTTTFSTPSDVNIKSSSASSFKNIKCYLCNARSLNNKLANLENLLSSEAYDALIFTETWFRAGTPDSLFCGGSPYNLHRCDRSDGHGGVAIFTHRNLCASKVDLPSAEFFDAICLDLNIHNSLSYRFLAVYNPPRATIASSECLKLSSIR